MDVQTGLVYVVVVIVSALVIGFVSVFAMREKSYEEAIAEQRKLPDDLLLGKKEKVKEKKHKNKTGKKVKEKKEEKEEKEEKPEHVKFEETPEILPSEPSIQENGKGSKKKGKVEKVKPILVNKDEPVIVISETSPSQPALLQESNHFDVIQPKDDLELIRSHSRENLHLINQSELGVNKSPKETPTKSNKKNARDKDSKKKEEQKEEKKEAANASPSSFANQHQISKENVKENKEKPKEVAKELKEVAKEPKEAVKETVTPVQSFNKESKKVKKKNDILAQIGGDRDGVNFSLLKPLVQKAELSRSEIQFLIDQLLNKQQDNPLEHAEWTESRADPVIKLKKQLADKEKALKDEQEASQSVQSKLMELRLELNSERSRLRQVEEALTAKSSEAQTLHTRMQHILESHAAEKQGFSRQIEQLQAKIAEDQSIILKMQEEQGQSHGQMQQELIAQRKQLELQISQMRDNENALKTQLAQKHAENQELHSHNLSISQELQAACENSIHEIDDLRQQNGILQEQVMHLDAQLQKYKEASDRLQDVLRQLKESQRAQSEMDHRIKSMHRTEQELQKQVARLQSELDSATNVASSFKEELDNVCQELNQLKSEPSNETDSSVNPAELTALRSQLAAKEEELLNTGSQLDTAQNDLEKAQSDIEALNNQLDQVQHQLQLTKNELLEAQDGCKSAQSDLNKYHEEIRTLQDILSQTQAEFSKIKNSAHITKDSKFADAELQIIKLKEDNERLSAQIQNVPELQKEVTQLKEKNESLISQLATSTQRPAVEGRENGIEEKVQKNSVQLVENTKALVEKEVTALNAALSQKQKQLDQLNSQVESLVGEINNQRKLTLNLQEDLEQQRSKNDDLRRKNWKVMEALNSAQSGIKNGSGVKDEVKKIQVEQQEATKALLQRIFPEIKVLEKSHDKWMKSFEEQVYTVLRKLKTVSKSDDNSELEKTNKNLQAMVNHYKQIIDDTEGMLNKLQSHIESEEKRWQAQFWQKENEVSNLRLEIQDLQTKISSNNELQQRITELETRLSEVESVKEKTKSESQIFQTKSPNRVSDLAVLEQLQEEKSRLSQQLQNESSQRAVLDEELKKLRALVVNSESHLAQEEKLVSQLQREISQIKNEVCVGGDSLEQSTFNGPSVTDTSKSEPILGAQCLIAALEKTLLKNAELENCSLTEPNNSVEFQQDIDGSLTSEIASNSCLSKDNALQNSCNSLNGQQHKKHKKKRKSTKNPTAKRRRFAGWFRKKVALKSKPH